MAKTLAIDVSAWGRHRAANLFGRKPRLASRAFAAFWLTFGVLGQRAAVEGAQRNPRIESPGDRTPTRGPSAPAGEIRDAVAEEVAHGFSGSVFVADRGSVLLNSGFGAEKGVRFKADTRFWIASAGKQFTSAAILKCREKGLLSLDDPVSKFFPAAPADKRAITIEQLLTHSSGFGQSYVSESAADREAATRRILAEPLQGRPGSEFRYSNNNYQMAVAIVEVTAGRSYSDFIRKELWAVAGLSDTGLSGDPGAAGVAPAQTETPARLQRASWGGEGVYSTTGDLHRWYQSLISGRVLSAESIARLLRPSVTISEGSSALGWFIGKSPNGRKRIFTRGNEDFGANALFYVYPERDTEIIVLTHAGNANKQLSWSRFLHAKLERLLGL